MRRSAAHDPKLVLNGLALNPDAKQVRDAVGKGVDWALKVWDVEANKELLVASFHETGLWRRLERRRQVDRQHRA